MNNPYSKIRLPVNIKRRKKFGQPCFIRTHKNIDRGKIQSYPPAMTICIAAIANGGRAIISACDGKGSFDGFGADSMLLKRLGLHRDWKIMISGPLGRIEQEMKQVIYPKPKWESSV